jgi:protein involved in polysaccharide export with SLBB domain
MSEFFFPAPPDQPPLVLEPGDTIEVVFAEADESPVFTGIAPRVVGGYVVDANGKLIDRYGVCDQQLLTDIEASGATIAGSREPPDQRPASEGKNG